MNIRQEQKDDYAAVYPKLGYVPANIYGIKAPFDVPDESFMAVKLNDRAEFIEGVIKYDEVFGTD